MWCRGEDGQQRLEIMPFSSQVEESDGGRTQSRESSDKKRKTGRPGGDDEGN